METVPLDIEVSPVFYRNAQSKKRIRVNQGGTGSGKTFSILQYLILTAMKRENIMISVVSATFPHLRKGAIRDTKRILDHWNLSDYPAKNKTESTFMFGSSTIEFFALDKSSKARGPRRDILYLNEVNLMSLDHFRQLLARTRGDVFMDYNPADEYHWIYDEVIPRDDAEFIQSTYLDNYDFLTPEEIEAVESFKGDENFWRVFGLGERGHSEALIYSIWDIHDDVPKLADGTIDPSWQRSRGLDFGFNVPSALIDVYTKEDDIVWDERLYEKGLTNSDIIKKLDEMIKNKRVEIFADHAEPDRIEEIYRAGYNIHKADKEIKAGIDYIKGKRLHITKRSVNLQKEIKSYKWKEDKNENILDEPVKMNDHAMDGGRYGTYSMKKSPIIKKAKFNF